MTLTMAANGDNGCGPDNAASGGEAQCQTANDCSGDPGVDCVGAWACQTGECVFECGSEPDPREEELGCYSDDDCSEGEVCNAAEVCHDPPGCGPDSDCAAVCYGECVTPEDPPPPPPGECTHSGECPEGEYCTTESGDCLAADCPDDSPCLTVCYGECKPRDHGDICYDDSQCEMGERCDRDPCVFPEPPSDGGGGDSDGERMACGGVCAPVVECRGPEDCDPGEICGCGPYPGEPPPNGLVPCFLQCMPDESACTSDDGCEPGDVCIDGVCQPAQRECYSHEECPPGWSCEAQCNSAGAPSDADPSGVPIYCPSYCVPQEDTCAETGEVCPPGERCVNECTMVCPDCDCGDNPDCECPCWEECRSGCVPDGGECIDSQCPDGTHCGCATEHPADTDGIYPCELKCIPDEVQCFSDADCEEGQECSWDDCWSSGERPACDPSEQSCDEDPADFVCPGTCKEVVPDYDCKGDEACFGPDGQQGYCRFVVCEMHPCDSDACDPIEPACYGYCVYDDPASCDPETNDCPPGTHCEATSNCSGDGSGFVPCLLEYQCVPDQIACETDCDCEPELACAGGVCMPLDRMNMCNRYECTEDTDCDEGEHCKIDPNEPVCDCLDCPCSIPHGTCAPRDEDRECQPTGCGGTVCADEEIFTTCEYYDYYECYKLAICDYDEAGVCGWQSTDAFNECMEQYATP